MNKHSYLINPKVGKQVSLTKSPQKRPVQQSRRRKYYPHAGLSSAHLSSIIIQSRLPQCVKLGEPRNEKPGRLRTPGQILLLTKAHKSTLIQ